MSEAPDGPIKWLALILNRAQGVYDAESKRTIDIGREIIYLREEFDRLRRENARLREALEWFADFNNYEDTVSHEHIPVWSEGIQRAKAALAKEEK
jgi:hypothetical protein